MTDELHLEPHDPTSEELVEMLRAVVAAIDPACFTQGDEGLKVWARAGGMVIGYDLCRLRATPDRILNDGDALCPHGRPIHGRLECPICWEGG